MALDQEEIYPYEKNMSIFDHIDDLRKYLFRMAVALLIGIIVSFFFVQELFDILIMAPLRSDFWGHELHCNLGKWIGKEELLCFTPPELSLQSTKIQGQFISAFKISFVMGLVGTFPFMLIQLWQFIKPALSALEVKKVNRSLFFATLFFFAGVLFAYFILLPVAAKFLLGYQLGPDVKNIFTINSVTGFICYMSLSGGLVFELPIIILILAKIGLISSEFLMKYWKYAVLVIFLLAGLATPPDIFSQLVLGLPLIVLYFLGVYLAKRVEQEKLKNEA